MKNRVGAVLEKPVTRTACKHHWLIEPVEGPTSKGICKLCGEIKLFDNVLADLLSSVDGFSPLSSGSLTDEYENGEKEVEAE